MMNLFRLLAFILVFLVFGSSAYAEEKKLKFRGASEFAITTKAMGASLISFLVAICIAVAIRKTVGALRLNNRKEWANYF